MDALQDAIYYKLEDFDNLLIYGDDRDFDDAAHQRDVQAVRDCLKDLVGQLGEWRKAQHPEWGERAEGKVEPCE